MSQDTNHQVAADEVVTTGSHPETAEVLEKLASMVVQLQRIIDCRSHESLQQPGHDGHWGVVEILCYLRDWEAVIHERVRVMMDEDAPAFTEPDTTMWPLDHEYRAQDSYDVFHELAELRGSLIGRLREMDVNAWDRTGVFEAHGEISLRDYLEHVAMHDRRYIDEAREAIA